MSRGFEIVSDLYMGAPGAGPVSVYDGRFYQPAAEEVLIGRRQAVQVFISGEQEAGLLPVDTYQDWVELDWKAQHGSWEAVERFGNKLVEEELAQEIAPELTLHQSRRYERGSGKTYTRPTDHLIDELGDYLWPLTALASNGAVSLNDAVSEYLHKRDLVVRRRIPLRFVDIDYILAAGHNPTKTPLDELFDDEDFEEYDPFIELGVAATKVVSVAEKQYGNNEQYFMTGWREKCAQEELMPAIGRAVVVLGYVAHQWARSTLAEVAAGNMRKVSARAAHNLIDKTDGDRSSIA